MNEENTHTHKNVLLLTQKFIIAFSPTKNNCGIKKKRVLLKTTKQTLIKRKKKKATTSIFPFRKQIFFFAIKTTKQKN